MPQLRRITQELRHNKTWPLLGAALLLALGNGCSRNVDSAAPRARAGNDNNDNEAAQNRLGSNGLGAGGIRSNGGTTSKSGGSGTTSNSGGNGSGNATAEVPAQESTPDRQKSTPAKPAPRKPAKPSVKATRIAWEPTFEAALAKAKASGKPVMIDFFAVWCGPCKILDKEIYTAAPVIKESLNFVNVKVDVEKRPDLERRYALTGYPTIIVVDGDGKALATMPGLPSEEAFLEFMRSGRAQYTTGLTT